MGDDDLEQALAQMFEQAAHAQEDEEKLDTGLADKLRSRIKNEGAMSLHDYMQACLADPDYGYYLLREPFGVRGDFITAPDVCQVFSELLGLWCVHVWAELGQPKNGKLIELGPGRGGLMSDALRAAFLVPEFLQSIEVHFVEISPALREAQKGRIEELATDDGRDIPKLFWHDRLEDVPPGPTLLLANEFIDALPIRQYQKQDGKWFERMVVLDEKDAFVFALASGAQEDLRAFPPIQEQAQDGDFLEIRPQTDKLVEDLASRAKTHPLAAAFIDYGYGKPGLGDTFQAIRAHQFADPLKHPGHADVTAHVDFSQLAARAGKRGLTATGPASQRDFLLALGAKERAAQLMQGMENIQGAHQFITGFQRLVEPDQMGNLFKVLGISGANQPALPGFGQSQEEPV